MRPVLIGLALALSLLTVAGCGSGSSGEAKNASAAVQPSRFRGSAIPGKRLRAPDFALRDQDGRLVRLTKLRGRFVVVSFLYTHCPDVCPVIADNLNRALARSRGLHGARGQRRPEGRHAGLRPPVRARAPAPARVPLPDRHARTAAADLERVPPGRHAGTTVAHSAFEVLVDRGGDERLLYDAQVKGADVTHDLHALGAS